MYIYSTVTLSLYISYSTVHQYSTYTYIYTYIYIWSLTNNIDFRSSKFDKLGPIDPKSRQFSKAHECRPVQFSQLPLPIRKKAAANDDPNGYHLVNVYMENHIFWLGNSTISLAMFNSYIKLPNWDVVMDGHWKAVMNIWLSDLSGPQLLRYTRPVAPTLGTDGSEQPKDDCFAQLDEKSWKIKHKKPTFPALLLVLHS